RGDPAAYQAYEVLTTAGVSVSMDVRNPRVMRVSCTSGASGPVSSIHNGDVVTFDGSTFQAIRDTGQPPTHRDWVCLGAAGRDARSPHVRGTFNAEAKYQELDIVACGGGSFIARRDDPGPCPGDGWQSLTMPGKKGDKGPPGPRGEKGAKGEQGPSGPII